VDALLPGGMIVCRHEQNRQVRLRAGEGSRQLESAAIRKADVYEQRVGYQALNRVARGGGAVSFAHDEVATPSQQLSRSAPKRRGVVDDHDANRTTMRRDRQRDLPPPPQEMRGRRADLNACAGHHPQFARKFHGFAQARYLELDTEMVAPGRHIASGLLARSDSAIPQLGDSVWFRPT
jgi:hypothetical protein